MAFWEPVMVDDEFAAHPKEWLAERMTEGMPWLLVHADDGVIWGGRTENGTVSLSSEVAAITTHYPSTAVELRAKTLHQARVFGRDGELLVWRTDDGFKARKSTDGPALPADAWEESHLLWGERTMEAGGFTVLKEGQQGQVHAAPLRVSEGSRAMLTVRHFVMRDDDDRAVAVMSRLVNLTAGRPGQEVDDVAAAH